jgi:diaminohydroxyphosphoribosylaminopyrimidine deaminase/5-amino-6-(5-phosphoribosylamino)uracil reductase
MVEGGSRILSAFLTDGLVDELIVYLAPTLLGSGTAALSGLGIGTLADAQRWEWDAASGGAVQKLGRDLRLHLRPEGPAGPHDTQNAAPAAAHSTSTDSLSARAAAGTAMGGY